jgi:DNA-binding transcriptional MerR regulator
MERALSRLCPAILLDIDWTAAYLEAMKQDPRTEARHSVRVTARRTGISPDVLRVWERRYGAVRPARSAGGQRLYSDADIERLKLLAKATSGGRAISTVVGLDDTALGDLIATDLQSESGTGEPDTRVAERLVEMGVAAVKELSPEQLDGALRQAVLVLGARNMLERVLAPLLRRIGNAWHAGELTPAEEHAASVAVRRSLDRLMDLFVMPARGSRIVVGTVSGERHEFGALLAGLTAMAAGWQVLFTGTDLPGGDVGAVARRWHADAVGVSVVHAADLESAGREIDALVGALPRETRLIVGGGGASALRRARPDMDADFVDSLSAFSDLLQRIPVGS